MSNALRVLLAEDREDDAVLILRELRRGGYRVEHVRVDTRERMAEELENQSWDVIISDYSMPQFSALGALAEMKRRELDLPFIIVSGTVGEDVAVAALKAGAHDFIPKNNLKRFLPALERELREAQSRRERRRAEAELRRMEEQFHQAQKMEAVGRLAGGIAHDFNNVLTVIQGYADMMRADMHPDHPAYDDLEEIIKATDRAAAFTRQLLAFSRKQVTQPVAVRLDALINDLSRLLHRAVRDDLKLELDLDGPLYVLADPGQMEQVIINLVVNASDAMPAPGTVTVRCQRVVLDKRNAEGYPGAQSGAYCCISVQDTGSGIPPEVLPHIFEPFYTTKDLGKGTGLGLSTVYGIVTKSGGFIDVDTTVGRGSTFKIFLPETEPTEVDAKKAIPAVAPLKRKPSILVVEDETPIQRLIARTLERAGFHVMTADDGAQALAILRDGANLDMLITDVMLPNMRGHDLAREALLHRPRLQVLLMSGYSEDEFDGGEINFPYLEKPFAPAELLRRVSEILGAETHA